MEKLRELAGFPIVPGTINVWRPGPLERGLSWRYVAATGKARAAPGERPCYRKLRVAF
jgi:hypothetical protein